MKRIIAIALTILLALPVCALASGMTVEVGPYTYAADGCFSYNYAAENCVIVDYNYAGVILQYVTWEELGITYGEIADFYCSGNEDTLDWEVAYALADMIYVPGSGAYLEYFETEDPDPCVHPACALINGPISQVYSASGICSVGIMVTDEGVLFIECLVYDGMIADDATELRQGAFNRLMYNGESVVLAEPREGAPTEVPAYGNDGTTEFTVGDYSFTADGYVRYSTGDYYIVFDYGYAQVTVMSYDISDSGITPASMGGLEGDEYEKAALLYYFDRFIIGDGYYTEAFIENPDFPAGTPLMANGTTTYGAPFVSAMYLSGNQMFDIEIVPYEEMALEDVQHFRSRILETVTIGGENIKLAE